VSSTWATAANPLVVRTRFVEHVDVARVSRAYDPFHARGVHFDFETQPECRIVI